ncbi:MAG: hypothetical protein OJF50_003043 [Nitrospira sp.]|nr:hypothetical protein [Nitrospira sp.]
MISSRKRHKLKLEYDSDFDGSKSMPRDMGGAILRSSGRLKKLCLVGMK